MIFVLLLLCFIFGYMWFFRTNKTLKTDINNLKTENVILEKEKDALDKQLIDYKQKYDSLVVLDNVLIKEYVELQKYTTALEKNAHKTENSLDILKNQISETRKEIEYLKEHPANRIGDNLVNSLKNKTK